MATIRLKPSIYTPNTSRLTLSNEANITDGNDTTYGTLNHTYAGTSAYYLYCGGFDFSSIPSDAKISSVTLGVIAQVTAAATNQKPKLYNSTVSLSLGTFNTNIGTSKTTSTLNMTVANFNTFKNYGDDARIRLYLNRSSKNTASNMKIYEVYINVDYTEQSSLKNIKVGTSEASKIYVGSNEVDKIYVGSNLVYEK